jgi:hypothetical protein
MRSVRVASAGGRAGADAVGVRGVCGAGAPARASCASAADRTSDLRGAGASEVRRAGEEVWRRASGAGEGAADLAGLPERGEGIECEEGVRLRAGLSPTLLDVRWRAASVMPLFVRWWPAVARVGAGAAGGCRRSV